MRAARGYENCAMLTSPARPSAQACPGERTESVAVQRARNAPWRLRHPADRRSLVTVLVAVLLLLLPQWMAVPAWLAPAWIVATLLACCASHVVVHNHCHFPLFATSTPNRLFNLVASIARGHCASDIYIAHNLNHHAEQGRAGDWITPALGGTGHPLLRLVRFVLRATISMMRQRKRLGPEGRILLPEPFRSSLPWEKALLPIVVLCLLWNDWRTALVFALLPWTASLLWLVGVNYVQHEGCDPDSRWAHSRNFTGRFTNWLLFNNGYHSAHHLRPGMHWSEVKQLHENIADHIPGQLNEPSATSYMLRRYLFNRADDYGRAL